MAQENKRYSILDELAKCSGYDIALMTTFNFEINFFERAILNRLYANDVRKISLFVDSEELSKALQEVEVSHIGRKYMVNPIKMAGSFHPKIILLSGEKKAKLFIGSANIKTSGYAINNEIFNCIEYSSEHPEYLNIIVEAIDYFSSINEQSYQLDNSILKECKTQIYYHKSEPNKDLFLLQNMKRSIVEQVRDIISEDVEEINIAVPYYDNELAAVSYLKEAFPYAQIRLYIQNEKSTFPAEYNQQNQIIENILIYEGFKDNNSGSRNNFYHGKVFVFKTKNQSYVLYGSANCTQAALVKSFGAGGNMECDFLEIGDKNEFDNFFENMDVQQGKTLISTSMIFDTMPADNFAYKYGEITDEINLHFSYTHKVIPEKICIGEFELIWDFIKDEMVVHVPDEIGASLPSVFEVIISGKNKEEHINCWTFNRYILEENRIKHSDKQLLGDFDIDSEGDKYIEDRCNLLKAELTCLPELQEHRKKLAYYKQIKSEQEGDDAESDEFIVEVQIPDEYRVAYRQYHEVSRIRGLFLHRFLLENPGAVLMGLKAEKTNENSKGQDIKERRFVPRQATSAEKSFERFIKAKVKGMLSASYVEIIEVEHYLGLVAVIQDIFNKYHQEKVEDIFDTEYVMKTKSDFFMKLLQKDNLEDNGDIKGSSILIGCYRILLDDFIEYMVEQDQEIKRKYESISRSLLMKMEKRYSLRACYQEHLEKLIDTSIIKLSMPEKNAFVLFIEKIYGYKNFEMLESYIQSIYDDAVVLVKETTMLIVASCVDMLKQGKPNAGVVREVKNYSRCVSNVNTLKIVIHSKNANYENKNVIVKTEHVLNLEMHNWRTRTTRKDGSMWESKTMFLDLA
jgi:hypothetical protein